MGARISRLFYTIVLFGIAGGLGYASYIDRDFMRYLFAMTGYYLIFLLVIMWLLIAVECIKHFNFSFTDFVKRYWKGLLAALLMTFVITGSIQPKMRVLSDEANLLSISKTLAYEKRTDNVTMGKYYFDMFFPTNRETPKRPLMFPFMVSLFHSMFGFNPANVYLFNAVVLFLMLSLVYVIVSKYTSDIFGISAVILVSAYPIVAQNATSGGFDLFSAFFLIANFMILRWFLFEPEGEKFHFLWVTLLVLTNIRHEGIMAFIMVLLVLTLAGYVKMEYFFSKKFFIYAATPLILLLIFWQRLLTIDPFENLDKPAFALAYAVKNNLSFLRSFFDYGFYLPYATVINLTGFLSIIFFAFLLLRKKAFVLKEHKVLLFSCILPLAFNWILYTSFHNGTYDHPSCSRYYVIFCIIFAVLTVFLVHRSKQMRKRPLIFLALSVAVFILYQPVSVEDRFSKAQTLPREYRFVTDFLDKELEKDRMFLVIGDRPVHYTSLDMGAVNFAHANRFIGRIKKDMDDCLYSRIFVVQDIDLETGKPIANMTLRPEYVLEPIDQSLNRYPFATRISRVVKIKEGTRK